MNKHRILAVEDSPTQGEMLQYHLERHGFDVQLESNGARALATVPSFSPDVVITDILMPEMDGYELCSSLKKEEQWRQLPVILVTGLSDPVEVVRALECGADGFMVKPYAPEKLVARVESALAEVAEEKPGRRAEEFELEFQGRKFRIDATRRQILGLLLSTYETAVEKNTELRASQEEIRNLNEDLEEKVRARTHALREEVGVRRQAEERLTGLNEALARRADQLRRLAVQLTRTEQAERQRLAGLLHDHLQQLLVGAKMVVSTQKNRKEPAGEQLGQTLGRVEDLLAEAIQISRDLTVELSPPILREGGLMAGLEWLVRRMREQYGLKARTGFEAGVDKCTEEITVFLFQAARELLFNVFKHAGVDEAEVSVAVEGDSLRLTVSDWGRGFEAAGQAGAGRGRDSFGLFSLSERVEVLGGSIEMESNRGVGSRVSVLVPCDPMGKASASVARRGVK